MGKLMFIDNVDICCGLCWGDEAKGKLVTELLKKNKYNFVCRWSGGSNAGHTIYMNGEKYHTHIIPSGVFYGIPSLIGPDCYINLEDFDSEMRYLQEHGFNTDLVKVSPRTHVITSEHKDEDLKRYKTQQGTTGKGIAPCARDKFGRVGTLFRDICNEKYHKNLWKEDSNEDYLYGDILCEGAQGFWLDINYGNYPYITSSTTLPYSACSLGFPPQKIRHIYGAAKIYDTRVGIDPDFPDNLLEDETLNKIAIIGNEFGTTTGRARKVNWLDLEKLITAINISGCTHIIISKIDVLKEIDEYKILHVDKEFNNFEEMREEIDKRLLDNCKLLNAIIYSDNAQTIEGL